MSEAEKAELFNRELDALLAGRAPSGASDAGALAVAATLSAADFSADSAIRGGLRRRLTEERHGFFSVLAPLFADNFARAAFAAAGLALLILPLALRSPSPPAPPSSGTATRQAASIPVRAPAPAKFVPGPAPVESLPPVPRAALALRPVPKPDPGLFASLPMRPPEGEEVSEFPIRKAGSASPITLRGVTRSRSENGSVVSWETEDSAFELRRERIAPEDLFQVRSL